MKKRPTTAMAYAKYLYMADRCSEGVSVHSNSDIVNMRVRAFIDGAQWAKRQKRRAVGKPADGGK